MDLRQIPDASLISETERLARDERVLLTDLLLHLREMERRRLFVTLGYGSLFAYAMGALKYSEDQAQFRVAAMRLMKELPGTEQKIASGALSLTNISLAKKTFRRLGASRAQKLEVLSKLENKTKREAERILAEILPTAVRPDQMRFTSKECVEYRFSGSVEMKGKVEELKGLLAHGHPSLTLGELFEMLCDLGLDTWRKTVPVRDGARQTKAEVIRRIWERAGHACERCRSKYALQIDHILPRAKGGSNDESNLRLLCRACNQRAAIEEFGQEKMDEYLG